MLASAIFNAASFNPDHSNPRSVVAVLTSYFRHSSMNCSVTTSFSLLGIALTKASRLMRSIRSIPVKKMVGRLFFLVATKWSPEGTISRRPLEPFVKPSHWSFKAKNSGGLGAEPPFKTPGASPLDLLGWGSGGGAVFSPPHFRFKNILF